MKFSTLSVLWLVTFVEVFVSSRTISGTIKIILEKQTSRIIGGENATTNQFPFVAAVTVRTSNSQFFCGGTLLRAEWVITAGQCVDGAILFTIQLGSIHLNADDDNHLTLATSEYFLHPEYNPSTLENDIGIIKFRSAITLTDYIRPIDMLAVAELTSDANLSAVGWGQTSDGDSSFAPSLQFAKVAPLSNDECRITYGNQIKDSMVCVGGNFNEGICHGDTGTPLVESYSRRYTVLSGIASFLSGNGCETTDPSGYTRIFPYRNWIQNITGHV